jgi:ribosomal protein S15P/S13E
MLTERINHISGHLKSNKKDFSTNRGLDANGRSPQAFVAIPQPQQPARLIVR